MASLASDVVPEEVIGSSVCRAWRWGRTPSREVSMSAVFLFKEDAMVDRIRPPLLRFSSPTRFLCPPHCWGYLWCNECDDELGVGHGLRQRPLHARLLWAASAQALGILTNWGKRPPKSKISDSWPAYVYTYCRQQLLYHPKLYIHANLDI